MARCPLPELMIDGTNTSSTDQNAVREEVLQSLLEIDALISDYEAGAFKSYRFLIYWITLRLESQ